MTTATEDLDGECIHLLTRRWCGICNGTVDLMRRERDLAVEELLQHPGWRVANYGGRCARCRTRYEPGTPIRKKTALDRCPPDSPNWVAMCCVPQEGQ
jgi:hypothetical protein